MLTGHVFRDMKCFVVFNATSELVFFSADDEFKRVIIEKQRQQDEEVKEAYACSDSPDMRSTGLSSQTNEQEVNMNTVATLFLPLFASQVSFYVHVLYHMVVTRGVSRVVEIYKCWQQPFVSVVRGWFNLCVLSGTIYQCLCLLSTHMSSHKW